MSSSDLTRAISITGTISTQTANWPAAGVHVEMVAKGGPYSSAGSLIASTIADAGGQFHVDVPIPLAYFSTWDTKSAELYVRALAHGIVVGESARQALVNSRSEYVLNAASSLTKPAQHEGSGSRWLAYRDSGKLRADDEFSRVFFAAAGQQPAGSDGTASGAQLSEERLMSQLELFRMAINAKTGNYAEPSVQAVPKESERKTWPMVRGTGTLATQGERSMSTSKYVDTVATIAEGFKP